MKTLGYAANSPESALKPYHFERRDIRSNDISIEILYCGVCHSDLHTARNDWGGAQYPVVPGHEIVGKVIEIGSDVTRFKVGDKVAVGCMVDSCQDCDQCHDGQEQYCRHGFTGTYGFPDRISGDVTQGGYSKHIVVREEFVLGIPANLDLAKTAPILCAGITTYSPLKTWDIQAGDKVGVVGLGGLGHMAVKLAAAMGAHVTVFSRTEEKIADAEALGANAVIISTNEKMMEASINTFKLIIDTVPVKHDVNPYVPLLDIDGTLVMVGQVGPIAEPTTVPMIFGRRRISGSLIGGIPQTQELLEFCAEKNVLPDCEMIRMDEINQAFDRMQTSDVRYRFVIDMASLDKAAE
ncbi:NADP-dependent alcohol dehydrogenase C 1 [Thalassocella blandensis]|nr:NADP-dependent alcohol dehydrogenase C 1 [Thalassocella blandensis]